VSWASFATFDLHLVVYRLWCCAGGGGQKGHLFRLKLWDANIFTNFSTFLNYGPFIIRCIPPQQGGPIRGLGFHRRSCLVGHGLGAGLKKTFFDDGDGPSVVLGSANFWLETEVDQSWDLYTLPETNEMIG